MIGALVAMAIFSMALGFQWSRRKRLLALETECHRTWHQWEQSGDGLVCLRCGQKPTPLEI